MTEPTKPTDSKDTSSSNESKQEDTQGVGEIQWTDDKIRWVEENTNGGKKKERDDDEDEDRCAYIDPFKDQDPFDTFSFRFPKYLDSQATTTTTNNEVDNDSEWAEITVRGYKTGSDEVWQSTGLTLWRASTYLCEHMTKRADLFHDKHILEVRNKCYALFSCDV